VNDVAAELLARGLHALRRSTVWWTVGIVAFAVLNAAFWPSLEGSEALEGFEDMGALLEAFGAQNLASPAGYLDGQVFALLLPLLLSGMAVAQASLLTAGDEDAGRLELLHALPVGRRAIWLSRWASSLAALVAVSAAVAVAVVVCLPVFSLDGVGASRVLAATGACALLAAFHASVAYATAGAGGSRGRCVGIAFGVLIAGYLASFVLPIADSLRAARRLSPWYWAVGEQPVLDGVSAPRLALLAVLTAALVWLGTAAVDRRDIRAA
jgi:ABC-2 type transport system permease protein